MGAHKDWSFLTSERLLALHDELGTWKEVAKSLGMDRGVLTHIRRRLGMEMWQYPDKDRRPQKQSRLEPLAYQIQEMASKGMNCGEIARVLGDDPETVRDWMSKKGIPRRRAGAPSGDLNPNWHGGRSVDVDGYILVKAPLDHPSKTHNGYIRLHRLVMEQKIGRYLTPEEVVHHIDGDPQNNQPDNLELFDHNGLHLRQEWSDPDWAEHQREIRRGVPSRRRIREEQGTYAPASS